jgi:hypothetical protein
LQVEDPLSARCNSCGQRLSCRRCDPFASKDLG